MVEPVQGARLCKSGTYIKVAVRQEEYQGGGCGPHTIYVKVQVRRIQVGQSHHDRNGQRWIGLNMYCEVQFGAAPGSKGQVRISGHQGEVH